MNSISEQLLSAMEVISNEAVSKLKYDKTVQTEIYSIVNLDTGEYKVRYLGNVFSAFASDLTETYKVEDIVYVNVPEGDFSNKKMITSKVSSSSLSYGQMVSLTNSMTDVSPNLLSLYGSNVSNEYGVVAGAPLNSGLDQDVIFDGTEGYHGLFAQYAKQYELIKIQGSFLTTFHSDHVKGNYGIRVEFYTKSEDIVSYSLDLSSFNGDPYSLSVYSPQSVVVKAQQGYLTGIKSISLFEENFEYDRLVEFGLVTDKQNTTTPNIFVKDVSINFVEQQDLTNNLYYLQIGIPRGNSFTSSISSLDLVGRLIYEGENILNEKTCECSWYIRDLSITTGSEEYDKNAGVTWRKIPSTSFDRLSLDFSDVAYQNEYKLVVIYNENVVMSAEMTVFNLNSDYQISLTQSTIGDQIQLQISDNLVGDWYLQYPDGGYSQFGYKANMVNVTDRLLYSSVRFYCAVYDKDKKNIIANLQHLIVTSESEEDITIAYEGEDSFRYDANGDIAVEDSEKERTLQVILTWKDGVGTSYKVDWLGPDGRNLSTTRYSPDQSMIENLWVDSNSILHYNIKQKYRVNFNNNTITVRIKTIDEKEYVFKKEILFVKDGDQGTNGTTYIATVRPFDKSTGLKLSGLNPLRYYGGKWANTLPLRCYVYNDGELINNNSNYDLTYKWTGVGVTLADGSDPDRKTASGTSAIIASKPVGAYVKVQVNIKDNINDRSYGIYCSYPIDVSVGFSEAAITLLNIDDIPSYIKYTASGINPSFYSNNIQFICNNVDYSKNIVSLTLDLLTIKQSDGLYYLKPASSFIFEDNSIALLKCSYSSGYLLHPIMMYLDTYGNEAINGWDGTSLELNEDEGYIYAPQVGAGEKDSYNRFTGVIMGKDSVQKLIGLYGYQAGINTFGLMQNGEAFFGSKSGGGQIYINGNDATIEGGGGGDSENGMTITLANLDRKGEAIKLGAGNFIVNYAGELTANSANIQGDIYANSGQIGGTARSGGWQIISNRIYSGSGSKYVALDSGTEGIDYAIWAGSSAPTSAKFSVKRDGSLYATSANIKGTIEADSLIANKSGEIGGWTISSNKITSNNGTIGIASSGTNVFYAGTSAADPTFAVTRSGKLTCKNAEIEGKITANSGVVGDWKIGTSGLSTGTYQTDDILINLSATGSYAFRVRVADSYLAGESPSTYSTTFSVSHKGKLVATDAEIKGSIEATKGSIGGWTINENGLTSKTGFIKAGANFSVDSSGSLTAKSGSIGKWIIESNLLKSEATDTNGNPVIQLRSTATSSETKIIKVTDNFFVRYDGRVYSNYGIFDNVTINTGTFKGSLSGATGTFAGNLTATTANFNNLTSSGFIQFTYGSTGIIMGAPQDSRYSEASIYPTEPGTGNCGTGEYPWDQVIGQNLIDSSTRKIKKNILSFTDEDSQNIDLLEPITYEFKNSDSGQRYIGLIAEDVYNYYPMLVHLDKNGEPSGIAYTRLAVVLLYELQKLRKRVSELEREKGE